MENPKPISFKLRGKQIRAFRLLSLPEDSPANISHAIRMGIKPSPVFDALILNLEIKLEYDSKRVANLILQCEFAIPDLKSVFLKENELVVPKGLCAHMGMIAVGLSRGYLIAKLENTTLDFYILPTINVVNMVKQDLVIKFKKAVR